MSSKRAFCAGSLVSGLIFLLVGFPAFAYRPFGTEDSGVAGKGVFQSELSFDYLKWRGGGLEGALTFVPIYGLTDNLEISCEVPYMLHGIQTGSINSGVGDVNLVAKYLFAQEERLKPSFTLKGVIKLDNADFNAGHGSGDKDYSLFAVCSKNFGKAIIHSHFGYTIIGRAKDANLRDISLFGIALDYALTDPMHLAFELNGNRHPDSTQTADPRNCLFGITYAASKKMIYDSAIKIGFSESSPALAFTAGASITL